MIYFVKGRGWKKTNEFEMKRSKDLYIPYRTQLIIADPNSVNLKAKTKDGTFLKYPKKTIRGRIAYRKPDHYTRPVYV